MMFKEAKLDFDVMPNLESALAWLYFKYDIQSD